MQKENWILERIKNSLNEKGYLTENDLLVLRTQLSYRDEYMELLQKLSFNPFVMGYLIMKEDDECFELYSNRQSVKDYLFMTKEVSLINDVESQLKSHEWCHHILLKNNEDKYQCVRCGVICDEKFYCEDYVLLSNCNYDEGRKLYATVLLNLEDNEPVTSIINKMLNVKEKRVIKTKKYNS